MKVFILADGEGLRWNNWGGVPKQLLQVNGETLLDRMCRLCVENGLDDITIVGSFKNEHAKNIRLNAKDKVDLFLKVAECKEPFIILNGDCYYTDEIIQHCSVKDTKKWVHYMCPHENKHTGKTWAEGYIYKVVDYELWTKRLSELQDKLNKGEIEYKTGWIINNYLNEERNIYQPNFTKTDIFWCDETDDFDYSDMDRELNGFNNDYLRFLHYTGYEGFKKEW